MCLGRKDLGSLCISYGRHSCILAHQRLPCSRGCRLLLLIILPTKVVLEGKPQRWSSVVLVGQPGYCEPCDLPLWLSSELLWEATFLVYIDLRLDLARL